MTTKNETAKEKQVPAFYIFDTVEIDGKKENKRIGAAFAHKTGNGFNLLINGKRYAVFPPKAKIEEQSAQLETTDGEGGPQ